MSSQANPVPDGYHSVTPALTIKGAADAIEFYKRAFGAKELMRLAEPNGTIGHAEIGIGDSRIMLSDENPAYNASPQTLGGSTVHISLYVEDVDKVIDQAVALGAKVVFPAQDQFYGDRSGRIVDPFGHVWIISTHQEDVSEEEMQKRFAAFSGV
jgi:PhnB protein